ncbi:uncharacterized protein LOC110621411 isoform X2 [Manihot esculenta]|uniref:Uncharacterized protein n=1 Tax=Manihot esculenta TaxID=3983 RepID=A0ACB7IID0_MANES|nr:uncharacterized protein LOC110621411 isoform X2 [Manihot esculenta]KAG8663768.1 hypothetical protein MANES_01G254700v8 [Manihot esculenta]
MRIRKNANISSLMFSHASGPEALQTHVCQLNQSPWDVIPFAQETYPSSLHQFEGEDSFNGNGSLGDSIGAVESVASLMEDAEDKAAIKMRVDNMVIDDNYEMERIPEKKRVFNDYGEMKIGNEFKFKKGEKIHCCNKSDGKGWHCKNEPRDGHSMCDHHLLKSYASNDNVTCCLGLPTSPSSKKQEKAMTGGRRGRTKASKKGPSSSSNPYEFYYYSGFGPLWGKRRGEGNKSGVRESEIDGINIATMSSPQNTTPSSTPRIENREEFDYVDDYDDDEDSENGDSGKKRMRKPVKARSLKSLM